MNILVIEDEKKIAQFLKAGLEKEAYTVDVALDGQEGIQLALKNSYDALILDLMIPYIDGIELCKVVKNTQPNLPVLMLTARGTTEDKLAGFEAGADDYLVKPFEFRELVARLKVLTRRNSIHTTPTNELKVGDLALDIEKKVAFRQGKRIELTAKEFLLLEYFMKNKGRVLSRNDLAENVWDLNFDPGTNVVEVYINILRKKIDRGFPTKLIHTRIGLGYYIDEQA